jgi:acetylornithine deacetylase/succinyl-diaminopimelate desuccinylase-like protein
MDDAIIQGLAKICRELAFSHRILPSWASHDAQAMAAKWQGGMIFIPSRDGISHHPSEFSSTQQIKRGADVLLNWLVQNG